MKQMFEIFGKFVIQDIDFNVLGSNANFLPEDQEISLQPMPEELKKQIT